MTVDEHAWHRVSETRTQTAFVVRCLDCGEDIAGDRAMVKRDLARLEAWNLFKENYGRKIDGEARRQFDLWWTQRQIELGGGLFLTNEEVDQIDHWMVEKGLKQRDRFEWLEQHPELWRDDNDRRPTAKVLNELLPPRKDGGR